VLNVNRCRKRQINRYSLPSPVSLGSILNLRFANSLPLHVGRTISTATFERHDVIDSVAFPAFRIAGLPHEAH
jgi:hypothetical protein